MEDQIDTQLEPENATKDTKPVPDRSAIVWAEPIERGDSRLVVGDITKALAWFRDKTGQEPKLIILNRKNECFAKEAGDGIKVDYLGGCLASEVWLSSADNFVAPKLVTGFPDTQLLDKRNKSNMRPMIPLGRPIRDLPLEKIAKLRAQGLGARSIAKCLQAEGVRVSFMTIHRAIRREVRLQYQDQ